MSDIFGKRTYTTITEGKLRLAQATDIIEKRTLIIAELRSKGYSYGADCRAI